MKKNYLTILIVIATYCLANTQTLPSFDCNQSTVTPAYSYSVPGIYTLQGATNVDEVVFLSCPNTTVYDTLTGFGRHAIVNSNSHFVTDRGNTPSVLVYFVKNTGTLTLRPHIQQPVIRIYYETGAVIVNQTSFSPTSISCTNISLPNYICSGVEIIENSLTGANSLFPYPNPVTNKLEINIGANSIQSIYITDILGQIIFEPSPNSKEIDVSNFENGVYFLNLQVDNRKRVFKIIKE